MNRYQSSSLAASVAAAIAIVLITAPAIAQQPGQGGESLSREAFEATQTINPDQLAKIDNRDGTWSYAQVEGFDPKIRVRGSIVTWRYEGQARFAHDVRPVTSSRKWVVTNEERKEPEAQVLDLVRIDRWGRRWRAEVVNKDSWRAAIEAADQDSAEAEQEPQRPEKKGEPRPKPGTVVEWTPQSWTHSNCDSSKEVFIGKETHLWEGESRTSVGTPDQWERTAVRVTTVLGDIDGDGDIDQGVCTGTILTQDFILTSAHCVSDDNNNPMPNSTITVCRQDVSRCLGAADVQFPSSYGGGSGNGGGSDFSDDWALIELTSTWTASGTTTATDMDMSWAEDSKLDNLTRINNLGFPGFATNCNNAGGNTLFHNDEREPLTATYTKSIRMKIDNTPGHSGGPIYYCPRGDNNICSNGDKAYVFGVLAGWNSVAKRAVGPKVPNFRDAAMAILFD